MAWRWSGRPPEEQSLEPRSLGRGRPRRALGYPHRTGGWAPCVSYKEGVSRTASGRTSGLRTFQPQTISVTSHGGAFWAGGSSQGTSQRPRCWQGLKGRPERQGRGEPSLGLEPVPGPNQSGGLVAVRLGPGPLWLLWAEIEGMRDLARGLEPVVPGKGGWVAQGVGIPFPP